MGGNAVAFFPYNDKHFQVIDHLRLFSTVLLKNLFTIQ
jgi:hypothetical protein